MDETGNTGENLLDSAQPIYALAAVCVDEERAQQAVASALRRTEMRELKFQRLRTSGPGRRNMLTLIEGLNLDSESAAMMVVHKPWMLAAKLVDELIEPRMLATGRQMDWYVSGTAKEMADVLFALAPRSLGDLYRELQVAFVALVRDYSEESAAVFLAALQRSRIVCANEEMLELLSIMIDTPAELEAEFATRKDALDPALTALYCQAGRWSTLLAKPFAVVHDDSSTVRSWAKEFEVMRVSRERTGEPPRPETLFAGEIEMDLPTMLESISFVSSEHDERVQLADVLAGAAAHVFGVLTGVKPPDTFARDLTRLGIADLIFNPVGP